MKSSSFYYVLVLISAIFSFKSRAQTELVLRKPESGNITHIAKDMIIFLPNYSYKASEGISLHAYLSEDVLADAYYTDFPNEQAQPSLNTIGPVSRISGTWGISPSGAATYAVPIQVVPGCQSVEPKLSVVYNSQSGNGLLGLGWTLAIGSEISRIGQNYFDDGKVRGVNLTLEDRFVLDGNRLVTKDTYGAAGSNYRTQNETFTLIQAHGTSGNGPTYFTAKTKDGVELEFGRSEDSRIEAQGRTDGTVLVWCINKMMDANGNYMTFHYYENQQKGEYFLKEIHYSGNEQANVTPQQIVKFTYGKRKESIMSYVAGSKLSKNFVLSAIDCYADQERIHHYEFGYTFRDFTRLKSITYFARDSYGGNSTIFWDNYEDITEFMPPTSTVLDPKNLTTAINSGDWDGDGKMDICRIYESYSSGQKSLRITPYLNTTASKNNCNFAIKNEVVIPVEDDFSAVWPRSVDKPYMLTDYDRDGKNDLCVFQHYTQDEPGGTVLHQYKIAPYRYDGNSLVQDPLQTTTLPFSPTTIEYSLVADFDGDQYTDVYLFTRDPNGNIFKNLIGFPGRRNFTDLGQDFEFGVRSVIDFNGNGKADILSVRSDKSIVYELNDEGTALVKIYEGTVIKGGTRYYPVDFNGDSKTDFLVWDSPGTWSMVFSDGKQFQKITCDGFLTDRTQDPQSAYGILPSDYNGDGFGDIIFFFFNPFYEDFEFRLYLSLGDRLTHVKTFHYNGAVQALSLIDYDGDGRQDLVFSDPTKENKIIALTLSYSTRNGYGNVTQIRDRFLNAVRFTYANLVTATNYQVTENLDFPMRNLRGGLCVLKNSYETNTGNGDVRTDYSYSNARTHLAGRGFLGFGKIVSSNQVTHIVKEQEYDYQLIKENEKYFGMFPKRSATYSDLGYIDETLYTNAPVVLDSTQKRFFSIQPSLTNKDLLNGFAVLTSNKYDEDGNLFETTNIYKEGETTVARSTNAIEFIAVNSIFKNRAKKSITTNIRNGQPSYSRTTDFDYYGNGNLKTSINDPYTAKELTATYTYDVFGNQKTIKQSAKNDPGPSLPDQLTTMDYDPSGRFRLKTRNTLGHEAEVLDVDRASGNVLRSRDANGLETINEYDDLDRLIKTTLPTGQVTTLSYEWVKDAPDVIYKVRKSSANNPEQETFFDKQGRAVFEYSQTFDGAKVLTKTTYTTKGQVYQKSEPYKENAQPSLFTTYAYDELGRVTAVTEPTGSTTQSYNSAQRTTERGNRSVVKTYDATGLVKEVTDNGGTIKYTYGSHGQPVSINTAGIITSIQYDAYGRQTQLTDPNAGTSLYEYNAYGQLVFQKDAANNTSTFTYDVLGRILTKSGTGETGTTTNVYDTKWKGALTSTTLSNGSGTAYDYDALGRQIKVVETVQDKSFLTEYTYDAQGRMLTHKYPSGLMISNSYTSLGYLDAVKRGTEVLWQCVTTDVYGRVTESFRGNGLTEKHIYNTSNQYLTGHTVSNLLDRSYDFDALTGNLKSRTDNNRNLIEEFTYDDLDRLIGVKHGTAPVMSMTYNSKGNITAKSDIGTYKYGSLPHALTEVESPTPLVTNLSEQTTTYSSFNKIKRIEQAGYTLDFMYGPDQQRVKTVLKPTNQTQSNYDTRFYATAYERLEPAVPGEQVRELNYIMGGDGLIAIYVHSTGKDSMYYTYTDHLGSITHITDATDSLVSERSYDAWGRLRNPDTWTYTNVPAMLVTDRGYTAHEHHLRFGIINMNGRLYDPVLGRMFSPDNYVQSPDNTQSYNRYAYVWNNPLKFTDPDGDFVFIPIIIGAAIGAWSGYQIGEAHGATGWGMAGYIACGALLGGASGGAALGVSAAGGGAMLAGMAGGAVAGAGFNGLATGWNGQAMLDGAWKGGLSGLVGGGVGAAIGGGWGALAGGGVGSGLNTALNGGSGDDILKSAAIGAGMGWGLYHASTYSSWKWGGGNKMGGMDISYRQFNAMQADFQRSRFWQKEYGGALMDDGSVQRFGSETRADYQINGAKLPVGARGSYHTHWDNPGKTFYVTPEGNRIMPGNGYTGEGHDFTTMRYHSPTDMSNPSRSIVINRYDASYYSGHGNYSIINPPIMRFNYGFLFWR